MTRIEELAHRVIDAYCDDGPDRPLTFERIEAVLRDALDEKPLRLRLYKPDAKRIEEGAWFRASGDCICPVCRFEYREHAPVVGVEWLHQLCNGKLVKL